MLRSLGGAKQQGCRRSGHENRKKKRKEKLYKKRRKKERKKKKKKKKTKRRRFQFNFFNMSDKHVLKNASSGLHKRKGGGI